MIPIVIIGVIIYIIIYKPMFNKKNKKIYS